MAISLYPEVRLFRKVEHRHDSSVELIKFLNRHLILLRCLQGIPGNPRKCTVMVVDFYYNSAWMMQFYEKAYSTYVSWIYVCAKFPSAVFAW